VTVIEVGGKYHQTW